MALSKSNASKGLRASIRLELATGRSHVVLAARQLNPNGAKGMAVVYFLRLKSGVIYIGSSTDLEQRLADHLSGQACRTTELDSPLAMLRIENYPTFSEARQREAQLKRWSHAKKEALIRSDLVTLSKLSRSHDDA